MKSMFGGIQSPANASSFAAKAGMIEARMGKLQAEGRNYELALGRYRMAFQLFRQSDAQKAAGLAREMGELLESIGQEQEAMRWLKTSAFMWKSASSQGTGNVCMKKAAEASLAAARIGFRIATAGMMADLLSPTGPLYEAPPNEIRSTVSGGLRKCIAASENYSEALKAAAAYEVVSMEDGQFSVMLRLTGRAKDLESGVASGTGPLEGATEGALLDLVSRVAEINGESIPRTLA